MREYDFNEFISKFTGIWGQGEHVSLLGRTGVGKTTLALSLLEARKYVLSLAVKRSDDTLDKYTDAGYEITSDVSQIMPDLSYLDSGRRVIYWSKPRSLSDYKEQSEEIEAVLNHLYLAGGWCCFLDDAGYITGSLQLSRVVGILLNQGRSAGLSVLSAITQPSSFVERVPSEALKQVRHTFIFRYTNLNDIKACANLCGINLKEMQSYMGMLIGHDFLFANDMGVSVVRSLDG